MCRSWEKKENTERRNIQGAVFSKGRKNDAGGKWNTTPLASIDFSRRNEATWDPINRKQ